jgi:hypothetical protein
LICDANLLALLAKVSYETITITLGLPPRFSMTGITNYCFEQEKRLEKKTLA